MLTIIVYVFASGNILEKLLVLEFLHQMQVTLQIILAIKKPVYYILPLQTYQPVLIASLTRWR